MNRAEVLNAKLERGQGIFKILLDVKLQSFTSSTMILSRIFMLLFLAKKCLSMNMKT